MDRERLGGLVGRLPSISVAVIGDFFLDDYLILDPALSEVSLETGLEAYQVVGKRPSPGAAGTVSSNLAALGVGRIVAVGATGDDGHGYDLRKGLMACGIETAHLLTEATLFTPTYTKPMLRDAAAPGGERELNRMDVKWRIPTPPQVEERVIAELDAVLPEVHAVIIADQVQERNRGVITDRVRDALADRADRYPEVVFFADSRTRIGEYRNVIIKPNAGEAARQLGAEAQADRVSVDQAAEHAARLAERTKRPVFVTLGANGILVHEGGRATHVPAIPVEGPIDIVGAGDSTVAGAVCALCAGATCPEAALVGNIVASITIQQLGATGTASPEQVIARFDEAFPSP